MSLIYLFIAGKIFLIDLIWKAIYFPFPNLVQPSMCPPGVTNRSLELSFLEGIFITGNPELTAFSFPALVPRKNLN